MKTNENLQKDIQDAIKWEPLLNAAEIGVIAQDGIVTLTGTVSSYAKKAQAEDAAKSVAGVRAVIEKIDVQFGNHGRKEDHEIATDILTAFQWREEIPKDQIKVKVEDGWVTLEGEVKWNNEKEAVKKVVINIVGVKGVTNGIMIRSASQDKIEKKDIEMALVRNAAIDDDAIQVEVAGNRVTLIGNVDTLYEKEEAGRIAWNAPGVWEVYNEIVVDFEHHRIEKRRAGTVFQF